MLDELTGHDKMMIYMAIIAYANKCESSDRCEFVKILNKLGYDGDEIK